MAEPKPVEHFLRPGTLTLGALPPLSLYVHLPWCLKKCPYCDFNSHEMSAPRRLRRALQAAPGQRPGSSPGAGSLQGLSASRLSPPGGTRPAWGGPALAEDAHGESVFARYLDALRADLEAALPLVWGRRVHTVFIGGGTPSLFTPEQIDRLLGDVRALLPLEAGCEITLEANPGTFERDRFRGYRAAGVTRLSVGVQSFDDRALAALGRVHDAAQARAALAEAREVFDTFNIDLMYALPGQTVARLEADLSAALSFSPPHLSIYHLTIEPNTLFASRPPPDLPDEDGAFDMLDRIVACADAAGLGRYEVSAFAQPGHACRHNLNYWEFGDYLGIGAGAHGKLSFPHRVLRQVRWRDPARYVEQALAGQPVAQEDEVQRQALPFEFMLNALRLKDGFALARFSERTGLPLTAIAAPLAEAEARGLLGRDLHRAWPTPRGFDLLSDLQALFLPAGPGREN